MNQLLVALDVDTAAQAHALADQLRGSVGGFKIGNSSSPATAHRSLKSRRPRSNRVFLDLKFHDIPNTVASAVRSATRLGVWMVTVARLRGEAP